MTEDERGEGEETVMGREGGNMRQNRGWAPLPTLTLTLTLTASRDFLLPLRKYFRHRK